MARATWLARDLTNAPASVKNPAWFAAQVVAEAATRPGLTVTVREPEQLAAEGFGGILAVGGGSATPPRLVELAWHPPGATRHVVLVGKGITFDTGGISIKPRDGMKLMRKDMGGAAAVLAATIAAADLDLPVRVTALAPMAENAVSGSAYRPGDVITHYDGTTSESTNSDAEGRLVLADALAYAVAELAPDVVLDLATLTGANSVALGKGMAALYSHDDELAAALTAAGDGGRRADVADAAARRLRRVPASRHRRPAQLAGPRRRIGGRGPLPARVPRRQGHELGTLRHVGAVLGRQDATASCRRAPPAGACGPWCATSALDRRTAARRRTGSAPGSTPRTPGSSSASPGWSPCRRPGPPGRRSGRRPGRR